MLYYIAMFLRDYIGAFNVLTYNTVRAGGALVFAFLFSVVFGERIIAALRALKIGQIIRKDHVADLHELHKGKSGTPTMGGVLILLAMLSSLVLWCRPNRLLVVAVVVFCALAAIGFLDDYISLRRKHNMGLTAKGKFLAQIIVGLLLGLYLVQYPIASGPTRLASNDIGDWLTFRQILRADSQSAPAASIIKSLPPGARYASPTIVLDALNELLDLPSLYDESAWADAHLNGETTPLLAKGVENLEPRELRRLNRLLIEAAFPEVIERSPRTVHTRVEIPGFKKALLPLGIFYVLFVVMIIVGSSNAVNLTDGLDGLAIGASIVSLLAYTGVAYVVSRADWSSYLYLIHVPEATELTVFGGALIGAGLGFLWFNAHPAQVFMGDTGSLALGGAIGTMAILTKQELLLLIVGGLFVMEAGSVIIQVASFKLRGRRVFNMAPLHHHFELKGWSETKVTIRFWILAVLFALLSMATLKLR